MSDYDEPSKECLFSPGNYSLGLFAPVVTTIIRLDSTPWMTVEEADSTSWMTMEEADSTSWMTMEEADSPSWMTMEEADSTSWMTMEEANSTSWMSGAEMADSTEVADLTEVVDSMDVPKEGHQRKIVATDNTALTPILGSWAWTRTERNRAADNAWKKENLMVAEWERFLHSQRETGHPRDYQDTD